MKRSDLYKKRIYNLLIKEWCFYPKLMYWFVGLNNKKTIAFQKDWIKSVNLYQINKQIKKTIKLKKQIA